MSHISTTQQLKSTKWQQTPGSKQLTHLPVFWAKYEFSFKIQESLSQPILRKVFKKLILSPKMTYFPHFGNNKNFPFTCRTFTLNHFSMPKIRYNFTEIEWADLEKSSKCAHFPHFEHNNIFLKNEKFLPDFYPIFHVSHQE